MEAGDLEGLLKVFESSLSQIKWKLKRSSKRRLETDILALITEMRPVIMVDYGGKMPELQERLCSFVKQCQKELPVFELLKVMVMEDMIYLVHAQALAKYVRSTLDMETEMHFIDLEQDPPKMMAQSDKNLAAMHLMSIQKRFSTVFHSDDLLQCKVTDSHADIGPSPSDLSSSSTSEFIDLSSWIEETQVTIPALNGWLLGYPVVYLFDKQHIQDAIYNLSTKSLHLFQILVCRNAMSGKGSQQEELMSFTAPFDLSLQGCKEPWAKAFVNHMRTKLQKCKQVWGSLRMEVSGCYPQAIVL